VVLRVCPLLLLVLGALSPARAEELAPPSCDVFYFGIGQPRDVRRAFACELAKPEPNRNWVLIAVMYLNGEGTPRDLGRARKALAHVRGDGCGVTCAALEEVLRRQEASPKQRHGRVDYCKDIAQTTLDVNYCLGVAARKDAFTRKRQEKDLMADLAPPARKRFAALAQAFARFKDADGTREYQNFRDGTIRGEAAAIMEERVTRHYRDALAAWGPQAKGAPARARPLAEADRELNEVYRRIMTELDAAIAEARAAATADDGDDRVRAAIEVKTATRDAERAWLRYAAAWQKFIEAERPQDAEATQAVRAFLIEQRIRELEYPSIGETEYVD
jgi:hypothetical protein